MLNSEDTFHKVVSLIALFNEFKQRNWDTIPSVFKVRTCALNIVDLNNLMKYSQNSSAIRLATGPKVGTISMKILGYEILSDNVIEAVEFINLTQEAAYKWQCNIKDNEIQIGQIFADRHGNKIKVTGYYPGFIAVEHIHEKKFNINRVRLNMFRDAYKFDTAANLKETRDGHRSKRKD